MSDPPHLGRLLARPVVLPDGGARFVVPDAPHEPDPDLPPTDSGDAGRVFPEGATGRTREGRLELRTRVAPPVAGRQRLWLQLTRDEFADPAVQVVFPRWVPQPATGFRVRVDLGDVVESGRYRFRFAYDGAVTSAGTVRLEAESAARERVPVGDGGDGGNGGQ